MAEVKSIWDLEDFKPYRAQFVARQNVLITRDNYYNGQAYHTVAVNALRHDDALKAAYKDMVAAAVGQVNTLVQGLIDPISTVVDVDTGLVPGGWLLHPDSAQYEEAVAQLFRNVNWVEEGDLFVNYGARMGVGTLLVVDDRKNRRVDVQALNPATVLPIYGEGRSTSREIMMAIIVEQNGEDEEAQVITPQQVMTFRNGMPVALYGPKASYPNQLGFVPVIDQPYIMDGSPYGRCAFQDVIRQLGGINSTTTQLSENIRKNANPQWVLMTDDELPDSPIKRTDEKLWKISANGGVEAIVATLDIAGVVTMIEGVYDKMEKKLPQFLLHQLVGINRVAAETIRIQLLPLIIHVERVRRSLDAGVVRMLQMAGRVAANIGQVDLAGLDNPMLKLDPERRIIPVDKGVLLDLRLKELQVELQEAVLVAQRAMMGSEGDTNG